MTLANATCLEDLIPSLDTAQSDREEIETLLHAIAEPSLIVRHEDIDLVLDAALVALLDFDQLPERTIDVMLGILSTEEDDDVAFVRKMAAADVLGHMGEQSSVAIPVLNGLLSFASSERDFERWLALRASKAIWKIIGDPNPAVDAASKLLQDGEEWLVVHATDLFRSASGGSESS